MGTLLCLAGAIIAFLIAAFGEMFDGVNRFCAVILGLIALAFARWIWTKRGWSLEIHEHGVVQQDEAIAWRDVREVVETRLKAFNEPIIRVTVVASGNRMVVNPINTRSRNRVFEVLLNAARTRNIPVRTEWEESE